MHLQLTKVRSGQSSKRYARLVQSYRRADGMPAQRVVANLGELSDAAVANLRVALEASRQGKAVVLPGRQDLPLRVKANLDYLDVAVALEVWDRWKLSELLNRLVPQGSGLVPTSATVASLVIQRCVAPGSKHYAEAWLPRTALPELLGVEPMHFNNSRIHRVLDRLDDVDEQLQAALPARYGQQDGPSSAMFMDVTDTWFEGRGCDLAQRDRTKEGLRNRHKVGIVLLCNDRGYPLRWQVIGGKRRDGQAMESMVEAVAGLEWVGDAPVVFDRAMGTAGTVASLLASGLRFLTATRRTEIDSYTDQVPWECVVDLDVGCEDEADEDDARDRAIERAAACAVEAGLQKVDECLYVLDLGVQERELVFSEEDVEESDEDWDPDELEGGASWLASARRYRALIERKEVRNQAALADRLGVTRARMTQIFGLLKLAPLLQEQVLQGIFGYIPDRTLRQIAHLGSKEKQRRALEEHAAEARPAQGARQRVRRHRTGRQAASVRLVAYFNPQMLVERRETAARHLRDVEAFVADLNRRLRSPRSRQTEESVHTAIANKLTSLKLLSCFEVRVGLHEPPELGRQVIQAELDLNQERWRKRRRYDGFVLLVGHPDLPHDAAQLVQLYRDKDAVEKDFQTIKSVVKLRPVFHRTDAKVRAHVTLCVLALLLERSLETRSRGKAVPMTAPAAFDELHGCHLNLITSEPGGLPSYCITEPTAEQLAILGRLRMKHLVEDAEVAARIQPRTAQ
jgi:hypothetical protein